VPPAGARGLAERVLDAWYRVRKRQPDPVPA
jgi:hypothetical protein